MSLEITKSIADIEKIKNFVAIDTIQNKKKKGGRMDLQMNFRGS